MIIQIILMEKEAHNIILKNCTSPFQTGRDCHNITYYNPNNRQFAKQGAVDSSTRLLKT